MSHSLTLPKRRKKEDQGAPLVGEYKVVRITVVIFFFLKQKGARETGRSELSEVVNCPGELLGMPGSGPRAQEARILCALGIFVGRVT